MAAPLLAIRPRRLGDVVLTTPALRALHRGHPEAAIHVVTDPPYAALVEGLPGVARVWATPRKLLEMIGLAREFRRLGFDWAIDFFGNPRSAQLALLSGARRRAGYDLRGRGGAYHVRVP